MDCILKAKELGQSIINSKEFLDYDNSKKEILENNLENDVEIYEKALFLFEKYQKDKESKLYLDACEIIEKYKSNNTINTYIKNKEAYNRLLAQISQIITHFAGIDENSKCSGCKGCHK